MPVQSPQIIEASAYGVIPGNGDSTPGLRHCLEACESDVTITFSPGVYHFHGDSLEPEVYFISNNQSGPKRIVFHLRGKKGITIQGNGAQFIFHGAVIPFVLDDCRDVTLSGFSMDWERPFYSQGEIIAAEKGHVDIAVDPERYPYHVEQGDVYFNGEGWSHRFSEGVFEMDRNLRRPAYLSGDNLGGGIAPQDIRAESLSSNTLRLRAPFHLQAIVGNILLLRHFRRYCPGIFMQQSSDIQITDVAIYHAGGMGVIGQYCENISLERCTVQPAPESGRFFSVTVDATHFVNCRGSICLRDCLFENQMDDPCNVHGINFRIAEIMDRYTLRIERVHPEQAGIPVGYRTDHVQLSHNDTLLAYTDNEIAAVNDLNPSFAQVRLKHPLPAQTRPHDVLENLTWTPSLEVTGCTARHNRARGFLISTPGKVVLSHNRISAAGSGIKISGDANYWFESGGVKDVLIRENLLEDCCYGPVAWGRAVIDIDPEIANPWMNPEGFHRNIRIEDNTFKTFDRGIVYARSVTGIVITGNSIISTKTYPELQRMPARCIFEACDGIQVSGNSIPAEEAMPFTAINTKPTTQHSVPGQ